MILTVALNCATLPFNLGFHKNSIFMIAQIIKAPACRRQGLHRLIQHRNQSVESFLKICVIILKGGAR